MGTSEALPTVSTHPGWELGKSSKESVSGDTWVEGSRRHTTTEASIATGEVCHVFQGKVKKMACRATHGGRAQRKVGRKENPKHNPLTVTWYERKL